MGEVFVNIYPDRLGFAYSTANIARSEASPRAVETAVRFVRAPAVVTPAADAPLENGDFL